MSVGKTQNPVVDYAQYLDDLEYIAEADARDQDKLLRQLVGDDSAGSDDEEHVRTGRTPLRTPSPSRGDKRVLLSHLNERFDVYLTERERKLEAARAQRAVERDREETAQCSFQPVISPRAERLHRKGQEGFGAFLAHQDRWRHEREHKRNLAQQADRERQARDEARQRTPTSFVSPRSRRILQERKQRFLALEQDGDGPLTTPNRHATRRGHADAGLVSSCHRGTQAEETFAPVISEGTKERTRYRPSFWSAVLSSRSPGSARGSPAQTRSVSPSSRNVPTGNGNAKSLMLSGCDSAQDSALSEEAREWLQGKRLSIEAEKDLIERLYNRSRQRSDGDENIPSATNSLHTQLDKARVAARVFQREQKERAKRLMTRQRKEEEARDAFYAAAPFSPRIETHIKDRDWPGHRIAVPSHLATDWASRRYQTSPRNAPANEDAASQPPREWRNKQTSPPPHSRRSTQRRTAASSPTGPLSMSFLDRQQFYVAQKQERLQEAAAHQRAAREKQDAAPCTFRPSISPRSRAIAERLFQELSLADTTGATSLGMEETTFDTVKEKAGDSSICESNRPVQPVKRAALDTVEVEPRHTSPSPVPRPRDIPPSPRRPLAVAPHPLRVVSPSFVQHSLSPGASPARNGTISPGLAVEHRGSLQRRSHGNRLTNDPLHYTDIRDLRLVVPQPSGLSSTNQAPRGRRTGAPHPRTQDKDTQAPRIKDIPWPTARPPSTSLPKGSFSEPYPVVPVSRATQTSPPTPTSTNASTASHSALSTRSSVHPLPSGESSLSIPSHEALSPLTDDVSARAPNTGSLNGQPLVPPSPSSREQEHEPSTSHMSPSDATPVSVQQTHKHGVHQPPQHPPTDAGDTSPAGPSPLDDPETLLGLSRWWADLVDAHLFNEGVGFLNPVAAVASASPSHATTPTDANNDLSLPLHRSSLRRDSTEASASWLRDGVLGACSPFEMYLPLPYVANALTMLLAPPPGQSSSAPKRKVVWAQEEASIRSPHPCGVRVERRRSRAMDDDLPGDVNDSRRMSTDRQLTVTTHRLYLVDAGHSLARQRAPIVAYNNEVTFREFIRFYEWLLPFI